MKRFFGLFLLVGVMLTGLPVAAQDFTLDVGPEFKEKNLSLPPEIIGYDGQNYFMYQKKIGAGVAIMFVPLKGKDKEYIRKFDKNLKPVLSKEIELEKDEEVDNVLMTMEKNFFLFSTERNPAERTTSLFYRKINPSDLSLGPRKKVVEASYDGFRKYKNVSFAYKMSRDSSKLLVYYALPDPDERERFGLHMFHYEMIPLWNKDFTFEVENKLLSGGNMLVDNEANVYLLSKRFFGKAQTARDGLPNYEFQLRLLNPSFDKPEVYTLKLPGKFLYQMRIGTLSNDKLICAGVYAEENKVKTDRGIYYFLFDPSTQKVERQASAPLEVSMFAEEELSGRAQKQKKREEKSQFFTYSFEDMILRSDGGVALVAEEQIQYMRTITNYDGSIIQRPVFIFNDILIINVNPDGSIGDTHRVRKQQRSETTMASSYGLAVVGDKLCFIFNDRVENLGLSAGDFPKEYAPSIFGKSKQVVKMVSVSSLGAITEKPLLSAKESRQIALPTLSTQVNPDELVLFFQQGNFRRLGRLRFP